MSIKKKKARFSQESLDHLKKVFLVQRKECHRKIKKLERDLVIFKYIGASQSAKNLGIFLGELAGLMNKIDKTLATIDNGTFGDCDCCGKRIPNSRLTAIPWVTECLSCDISQRSQD